MKKIPFHPILFAFFPIISLYVTNRDQIVFRDVVGTILIILAASMLAWALLARVLKDWARAGILISLFLFLFFSFRYLLTGILVAAAYLGRYQESRQLVETQTGLLVWLLLCAILFSLIAYRILIYRWDLSRVTLILNVVSVTLIASVLITWIRPQQAAEDTTSESNREFEAEWITNVDAEPCLVKNTTGKLPDIYYIILDGYGRDDVLSKIYAADNSSFRTYLKDRGFYVARDSRSNYLMTVLSLSSSLNMTYLDDIVEKLGVTSHEGSPLKTIIGDNRVFHQLRCLGYRIVTFPSGFWFTDLETADQVNSLAKSPSSFENILINNSPLTVFMLGTQYSWHRDRITYALDNLPVIADQEGPKMVFAHILAPHPPFVFGRNGEPVYPPRAYELNDGAGFRLVASKEEYIQGYHDQTLYLSEKVETMLDGILSNSTQPPIIIVQGDHGPGLKMDSNDTLDPDKLWERGSNLNAYYFPGDSADRLYPGITPVNTFRVIFDEYLGGSYTIEEDRTYYSSLDQPYLFTDVTDRIQLNNNN